MSRHSTLAWNRRRDADLARQTKFEKSQQAQRNARICKVARDNPDLGLDLLGERFGLNASSIGDILQAAGIRTPRADLRIRPWARRPRP